MVSCFDKTDAELVVLSLQNPDAFGCIVERYEGKLMRYILRTIGIAYEDAENLLQEVFIRVYRNLNDYDPKLPFSSWIYRIAHNRIIDEYRKSSKNPGSLSLDDEDIASIVALLRDSTDIEEDFRKKELSASVRETIRGLPPKYREILILRYLEDSSYEEISDILTIPMGTVATLVNRAKQAFRTQWEEKA